MGRKSKRKWREGTGREHHLNPNIESKGNDAAGEREGQGGGGLGGERENTRKGRRKNENE